MKRRTKKIVLGVVAACYMIGVAAYVWFILAASSWGGAWCDNCTPDQWSALYKPRDDALREVLLYDALVFVAGIFIGRWWLLRPERTD